MAASPSSFGAFSEIDHPSSPGLGLGLGDSRIYASRMQNGGDDDDDTMGDTLGDTMDATPDGTDKPPRSSKNRARDREKEAQSQIGKIRHLKKEDGEPLWRRDIQYDFLKGIFDNEQPVFTNSYDPLGEKQTFADLYIDTMARSSKTSKVLRDKLMSDKEAAKGMAMVCLLVNMGRMNTTLNFFPEMRAQLRTYHAIPSLQCNADPHAYKQLQDAPRLKSILKGGAEDREEPNSLDKLKQRDIPRTNPVQLIFVMCNSAQKVAELHFPLNREFHDVIVKTNYTSRSRARAFLWLMWFYLESDFTEEGCEENPFGPGVDYGLDVANQGVPELEEMTPEEETLENVDPDEELDFGNEKQRLRATILEMDHQFLNEREKRNKARPSLVDEGPAILPRIRPSKHESDKESTRSTSPPLAARSYAVMGGRRTVPLKYQIFESNSPARANAEGVVARKPRPPTAHQLAVERNRNQRVEYILDRGIRKNHHKSRKVRRQEGAIFRAYQRIHASQDDPFDDSDAEASAPPELGEGTGGGAEVVASRRLFREQGVGGLCLLASEVDDYGEEVGSYAGAVRRSTRRLARWRGRESELGVVPPMKKPKPPPGPDAEAEADPEAEAEAEAEADDAEADHNGDVSHVTERADDQRILESRPKTNGHHHHHHHHHGSSKKSRSSKGANGDVTMDDVEEYPDQTTLLADDEGREDSEMD